MERTCGKCGFLNPDASGSATEACPNCGAIFAKVENKATIVRPLSAPVEDRSGRNLLRSVLIVAIAMAVIAAAVVWTTNFVKHNDVLNEMKEALRVAENNRNVYSAELAQHMRMAQEWNDTVQLATRSSRMSLATPMLSMQAAMRVMKDAKFQSCIATPHATMIQAADLFYNDMLNFMGDTNFKITDEDVIAAKTNQLQNERVDCDAYTSASLESAQRKLAEFKD